MGVSILLGLVITPVIVRALGKESYGLWGLAASFVGFYGLFDFGLSMALSRFLGNAIGAKDIHQFNRVASTGKCFLCVGSLLVIIFAVAIVGPAQSVLRIPERYADQFFWLVLLVATNITISMIMAVYGAALQASEDFVYLSCIELSANIVRSASSLAVVLAKGSVVGLAVVSVLATSLQESAILWRCRKRFPQLDVSFSGFEFATARTLAAFALVTYVVTIAAVLRSRLDVVLVTRFGGLGQAGIYALACTAFRYFSNAVLTVAAVTWPRLNSLQGEGDRLRLQEFFNRASHLTAACTALLTGLLVSLAPSLLRLWIGQGFEESATVLQILSAGYFLDFATNPGIGSLYATAKHRYFAAQTTVEGIASFSLALILGAKYGMKGVAFGIVIPITLIKLTIQPWYVARTLDIPFRSYWLRAVGMPTLALAAFGTGFLALKNSLSWLGSWSLLPALLLAMVIPCALLWTFVLDRDDRASVVSRIKRAHEVICMRKQSRVPSPLELESESKDAFQ
jgi:O-antigen/teichoic acid export membrane protein